MPLLTPDIDLRNPNVDTTRDFCGNSLYIEEARQAYREAYGRALEYTQYEQLPGDIMEFGTYSGFTARILAEGIIKYNHKACLQLFDSFEGFPKSEEKADTQSMKISAQGWWKPGELSAPPEIDQHIFERLSPILGNGRLFIHKGFFEKTFPAVASVRKASIVHLDCDLYVSAKYVLDTLCQYGSLQDGTVLLFDDYYCNRANPNFGERAALRDFLAMNPRFEVTQWFTYSVAAAAFIVHDKTLTDQSGVKLS